MSNEFDDILTILTLSVLADKKIYASEIDTLVKAATRIHLINDSQTILTEAKVLVWFENNKDKIKAKMNLPRSEFDAWVIPVLKRIKQNSDIDTLTHLMEMIAVADGEVHVSERALINLVKRNWA